MSSVNCTGTPAIPATFRSPWTPGSTLLAPGGGAEDDIITKEGSGLMIAVATNESTTPAQARFALVVCARARMR